MDSRSGKSRRAATVRASVGGPRANVSFDDVVTGRAGLATFDTNGVEIDEEDNFVASIVCDKIEVVKVVAGTVGRGGNDVKRVPTVMVERCVAECEKAEEGIGIVEVASGRGLSKEPVI